MSIPFQVSRQERRKHKNLGGGRAWFLRARQAWESIKSLAQLPKKLRGGGGLPPIFFFRTISRHQLHYWVGVPSVHNTDLRGDKQKKNKKNTWNLGGDYPPHLKFRGGHVPPVPPASAASVSRCAYMCEVLKWMFCSGHRFIEELLRGNENASRKVLNSEFRCKR